MGEPNTMDRFIWLDSEHVVNLDAIAYFKVESDRFINVILRTDFHEIQVEDEYLEPIK